MSKETKKEIRKRAKFIAVFFIIVLSIPTGFTAVSRVVSGTNFPFSVVLSDSMEPTIPMGSLIFIQKVSGEDLVAGSNPVGDVVVYYFPNSKITDYFFFTAYYPTPWVHRAIDKVEINGTFHVLLKGDANTYPDQNPLTPTEWVPEDRIIGKVVWFVPYLGFFTLLPSFDGLFFLIMFVTLTLLLFPLDEEKEGGDEGYRRIRRGLGFGLVFSALAFGLHSAFILVNYVAETWGLAASWYCFSRYLLLILLSAAWAGALTWLTLGREKRNLAWSAAVAATTICWITCPVIFFEGGITFFPFYIFDWYTFLCFGLSGAVGSLIVARARGWMGLPVKRSGYAYRIAANLLAAGIGFMLYVLSMSSFFFLGSGMGLVLCTYVDWKSLIAYKKRIQIADSDSAAGRERGGRPSTTNFSGVYKFRAGGKRRRSKIK
jgi:signal peptidase